MIVDDAVQHDISLNVANRKPLDLLNDIASGYGLALSTVGDVYMLSESVPTDLTTYSHSGTASYPMKYLKAADAKSLLPTFLYKYVHEDPEQNAVVVTAPPQLLQKVNADLTAIDVPPSMVMIECAVVELTDSRDLEANFHLQYQDQKFSVNSDSTTGNVNFNQAGVATAIVPTPQIQAALQLLISKGRAEVHANPTLAAVNGKTANIFIGSQQFVTMQLTQNGVTQSVIETVPVGVKLTIQPWTNGKQDITVSATVEVSNIQQIDPQTGIPLVSRSTASTTLSTKDGDTIIIGGLGQKQEADTEWRIPVLSSLPLIGGIFRSQSKTTNLTKLVILLRPRILNASGQLPPDEDSQLRQKFLVPGDLGCPAQAAPAK